MRIFAIAFGLLLAFQGRANAWYSYYRLISAGLATTSDQANFPLLIQLDSSNAGTSFKTVANGGRIQNTVTQSGGTAVLMPADCIFISGNRQVPFEVESYDPVNGVLKVWVNVQLLFTLSNTAVYVYYGDASVTTQQNVGTLSPANVWDSNYKGVWHLPNGTTLSAVDSTVNANNGTLVNTPTATTGQIDGAGSFSNPSDQYIDVGTGASLNIVGAITVEAWVRGTATMNGGKRIYEKQGATTTGVSVYLDVQMWFQTNGRIDTNSFLINTTYHYAGTHDGATTARTYQNGVFIHSNTSQPAPTSSSQNAYISKYGGGNGYSWTGWIDELRVSNIARSADWIATEYANQNAPLTFNSVGVEITPAPLTWAAKHRVVQ